MAQRNTRIRDLILGLLFFGSLFGLAWITTQLRNFPGMAQSSVINVLFEDVYGLRREDSVLVFGTRFGRVSNVTPIAREAWDRTGRGRLEAHGRTFIPNVLVEVELDVPLELFEDYRVFAADANLLGGKQLDIEPGNPQGPKADMGPRARGLDVADADALRAVTLVGSTRPHPITAIGKLVEDNQNGISEIVENFRQATAKLNDPAQQGMLGYLISNPDGRKKLENVVDSLDGLATQSRTSGNLMHELFYGDKLRGDAVAVLENARDLTEKAKDPNSLIGSLVTADAPLKRNVDGAVADIRNLIQDARRPGSLIARLTDDGPDSLGADVKSVTSGVKRWIEEADRNPDSLVYQAVRGDLGRTVKDAFTQIDTQAAKFGSAVLDPIAESKGAIGYLINDPESKQDLRRLINAVLGIVEDAREAAPISGLGSFIFGAF